MSKINTSLVSKIFHCSDEEHSQNHLSLITNCFAFMFEQLSTKLKKILGFFLIDSPQTKIVETHGIRFITKKH